MPPWPPFAKTTISWRFFPIEVGSSFFSLYLQSSDLFYSRRYRRHRPVGVARPSASKVEVGRGIPGSGNAY